jgi:hypothetical protein
MDGPTPGPRGLGGLGGLAQRLGPKLTTLAVVDLVLVLGALTVVGLLLTGGLDRSGAARQSSQSPTSSATTTLEEGVTSPSIPTAAAKPPAGALTLTEFAAPSRNIVCRIMPDSATCTIASFAYPTPPATSASASSSTPTSSSSPTTCSGGTVGHLFVVTKDGVQIPCLPGRPPAVAPAGATVLAYGTATSVNGFTCSSDPSGILCRHDASGHGFKIARAGFVTV